MATALGRRTRGAHRRDPYETHSQRVRADFLAGVQNGVSGTPGLFLNGVRYDGEWDKESLRNSCWGAPETMEFS